MYQSNGLLRTDHLRLLADSAVTFILRASAAAAMYFTQVILARWMGATELGHYVFALSWLWLLSMFATLGVPAFAHRLIPAAEAQGSFGAIRGYMRWARRVVPASGVAVAVAAAGVAFLADPSLSNTTTGVFLIACAAIPFIAQTTLYVEVARAYLWYLFASVSGVFLRPLAVLILIAVAIKVDVRASAGTAMLILLAVVVVIAAGQLLIANRRLRDRIPPGEPEYQKGFWLRIAVPLMLGEMYAAYYVDLNIIVSGFFLGPDALAVYNAALRTVAIISFGTMAVGLAVAPRAARLHAERDTIGLQRLTMRATHLMLWPTLVAVVILAVFGRAILSLFGAGFVSGYSAMLIVAASQIVISVGGPLMPILRVTGHQDRCLVVSILAMLATVIGNMVFVPKFGIVGGAVSILVVTLLWTGLLYRLVVQHIGIHPWTIGRQRVRLAP